MEKKFYSRPTCKVVVLDLDDIVCGSPVTDVYNQEGLNYKGQGSGPALGKQRGGIWEED